jgi:hypothetical protein
LPPTLTPVPIGSINSSAVVCGCFQRLIRFKGSLFHPRRLKRINHCHQRCARENRCPTLTDMKIFRGKTRQRHPIRFKSYRFDPCRAATFWWGWSRDEIAIA